MITIRSRLKILEVHLIWILWTMKILRVQLLTFKSNN